MMDLPEIQNLVDGHAQESPTLEIKAAASLGKTDERKKELVKDISALANAGGGVLIYGITQTVVDGISGAGALDPVTDAAMTGDWITQVVKSNTMPPLSCFRCEEIPTNGGRLIVVHVDQSSTAHQSMRDHRYWLRGAATNEPMLDFQIRDVMNRHSAPSIQVTIDRKIKTTELVHLYWLHPHLENIGSRTLERWTFQLAVPRVVYEAVEGVLYERKREGILGIEYIWLTATHWSGHFGRSIEIHPGQLISVNEVHDSRPPHLRITNEIRAQFNHPILWRIYSPNAKPLQGEVPVQEWCTF